MGNYARSISAVSFGILLMLAGLSCGNFPVLDVDTNMRIVLVPYDTPVGTIIYRLRASDSDNNFPLSFEVLGAIGKSILSLRFLGCEETESLCQADVVLKKALDRGRSYEFQLQVKDTVGDYTKVHSVITATTGTANFNPTFIPRIIHLDESTPVGTELEKFVVAKNELNSRHVFLEIRDKGDRIALKQRLVSNNKTEGMLLLKKRLDYETEPWFTFQLLAMNAYTNTTCDTRNILVSQVIVAVHDVQDTPPFFTALTASVELKSSMKPGDLITTVAAEDGDKQNKRLIRYGFLTDSNPFVVFFDLDPMSGEIHLRRNLTELLTMAKPNEPIEMTVIAEEIIPDSGRLVGKSSSSSRSSSFQDNTSRAMGKITFWFGRDSSFGPAVFSSNKYVGEVKENSVSGTLVSFGLVLPRVSHQHPNEIIALSLQPGGASNKIDSSPRQQINNHHQNSHNSNNDLDVTGFQILPSQGSGNFSFEIRVTDSKVLDYETMPEFTFLVVAVTSCGLSSEAQVTIHIRDVNDESPVFTQSEYHVELLEHAAKGTKVLQVQAIDKDTTGNYGKVTYSNLIGSNAFRLDPVTGDITVERPELIDRELEPEIRLYVEAKDGGYSDAVDPNTARNLGTTTVIIKLTDKNDHAPEFLQKYYQAILNPGLTELKEALFLKAFDPDEGVNSQIRYQVKDTRFFVDPISGEFRLRGGFHRDPKDGDNPFLGSVKVYAYDLGNPKMTSETSVQLFSEEMVTREIQFIFPSSPDKIRRNKTNFEIMLSKLSGGVVAIQTIAPYHRYSRAGAQVKGEPGDMETTSSDPGEEGIPARFRQTQDNADSNNALSRRAADLQSPSDKSIVTATVQYPVSATPTRVDLSQIPNVYGQGGGDGGGDGQGGGGDTGTGPPDTDRLKIYEAENRALFWILISFLVILLLLFVIFLCCVYCPWCWLYGHCYSKGDKDTREHSGRSLLIEKRRRSESHPRHKTYPEKVDEEEADYREDFPRPPPARGHRQQRREAWSGDERKGTWRTSHQSPRSIRRYRATPPPRSRKVGPQPHETDVALEDWEFDPGPPRPRDQGEEIGSRWQLQQQQPQQMPTMQPTALMPMPVAVPVQAPRRVAFGNPGQVDGTYMRRSQDEYLASENQAQRGGYVVARPAQSLPPGPDERATSHLQQRKTRFFRTETGEVLQFGEDYEGDEGKELLMKRYIDEQHPSEFQQQQSFGSQHRLQQVPGMVLSESRLNEVPYEPQRQIEQQQQGSTVDRPRAAIVSRRHPKNVSLSKDVTFEDDEEVEPSSKRKENEESTSQKRSLSRSNVKKSKSTRRSESESEGDGRKDMEREDDTQVRRQKRGKEYDKRQIVQKSPTPPSDGGSRRSRSPSRRYGKDKNVSKSPSRSKTRSESRSRYKSKSKSPSRSKSGTRSRSVSPPPANDREKRRAKAKQQQQLSEREGKQQRLKRHHHIQQNQSKGSKEEYDREKDNNKEHRSHHHHHKLKQKDSKQQHASREELSREKSKSLDPSLISLPLSIDDNEPDKSTDPTSKEIASSSKTVEETTGMREHTPPEEDNSNGGQRESWNRARRRSSLMLRQSSEEASQMQDTPAVEDNSKGDQQERWNRARRRSSLILRQSSEEPSQIQDTPAVEDNSKGEQQERWQRARRRSSLLPQSSEDATQMESMVDINIIPPSSAMTDSSYNPRDADGMMSDGAPPTPDGEMESGAQQPETTISTTEKDERLDDEDVEAVAESRSPERDRTDDARRGDDDDDDDDGERRDTIPEREKLENETIASQSTLDIAEAEEAAAVAVAPNDSVENPPPGDDAEPGRSLDRKGPEEDDDSGIGMVGYLSRRNKMLEKKSVFTIAYDEVASTMRPDTRGSTGETENEMSAVVK